MCWDAYHSGALLLELAMAASTLSHAGAGNGNLLLNAQPGFLGPDGRRPNIVNPMPWNMQPFPFPAGPFGETAFKRADHSHTATLIDLCLEVGTGWEALRAASPVWRPLVAEACLMEEAATGVLVGCQCPPAAGTPMGRQAPATPRLAPRCT